MRKFTSALLVTSVLAIASIALTTGCVTSKVAQVNPTTGVTNFVTVVNQENLDLDAAVLQGAVSVAVVQVAKNPQAVAALTNAHVALDGILSGVNQQTTAQVVALLKVGGNEALSAQVDTMLKVISALEQKLLAKYGASVSGQIAVALTKAVNAGIVIGLAK
jgi:hypothetical protein